MSLLHTIDPPNPGAPATGLLRAALVITHNSTGELQNVIDAEGAGSDNAAVGADDMRWANGLEFAPYSCADAVVFDPCVGTGDATGMSTASNRAATRTYTPFVVDTYDKCSTFGWQAADYEARARQLMATRESKAVGHEFWAGTMNATNPHLADGGGFGGGTVVTVGTGISPRNAIGALCQALHDENGGAGMIHMRGRMLEWYWSIGALRYEGGKYYTATGALVVGDPGYPGTGPTGQAIGVSSGATTEWMFATDLVEVHRGPVDVFAEPLTYQSIDHRTNNEVVRAQRLYAPIWNGCALAAVSVTTPATDF